MPRPTRVAAAPVPAPSQAASRAPGGMIADIERLLAAHGKGGLEELIRVLS